MHWQLVCIAPPQPQGPPAASHLKGPGAMPRVGVGRAAMSGFPRNQENLDLCNVHKLPQQRGGYLSGGLHRKNP